MRKNTFSIAIATRRIKYSGINLKNVKDKTLLKETEEDKEMRGYCVNRSKEST